jgi:2,3-bisphosphoglycerate-dependent phosphoglycerate mutase
MRKTVGRFLTPSHIKSVFLWRDTIISEEISHNFYFLRHGETQANHSQTIQGHADYPLNDRGRLQADTIALEFQRRNIHFTRIITSPLRRARDTAVAIGSRLGLQLDSDPLWMERDVGKAQGLDFRTIAARFGAEPESPYLPRFPGGDSEWEIFLRAARAVISIAQKPGGTYLIVSHGGTLNAAMMVIGGDQPNSNRRTFRWRFENTAFAHYQLTQPRANWLLREFHNPIQDLTSGTQ